MPEQTRPRCVKKGLAEGILRSRTTRSLKHLEAAGSTDSELKTLKLSA